MLDFQAARWLMPRKCRSRPATIIRPRSRPACSRPPTATSTSPPPASVIWERFCNALGAPRMHQARRTIKTGALRSKNREALNAEIDSYDARARPAPSGSRSSTRPACRAGRSTRSTRCSPIRRSSTSASRRARPGPTASNSSPSSASRSRCRARRARSRRRRRSSASTPTRCSRNSVSRDQEIAALHAAKAV